MSKDKVDEVEATKVVSEADAARIATIEKYMAEHPDMTPEKRADCEAKLASLKA